MAGRRQHGEGSVYQRSRDGRWVAIADLGAGVLPPIPGPSPVPTPTPTPTPVPVPTPTPTPTPTPPPVSVRILTIDATNHVIVASPGYTVQVTHHPQPTVAFWVDDHLAVIPAGWFLTDATAPPGAAELITIDVDQRLVTAPNGFGLSFAPGAAAKVVFQPGARHIQIPPDWSHEKA